MQVNKLGEDEKEKVFSEIKYMEEKISNLFNSLNNIQSRNYNMVTSELPKENTQKESSNSNQDTLSQNQENSVTSQKETEQKDKKQFELKETGVLTNNENINWDIIKKEVENMYASIPTITIDLYKLNINKDDILGFNSSYDSLTQIVIQENKEQTLKELVKVYEYIPRFLNNQDELYKTIVETKLEIFKGYSKLDTGNWEEIEKDLNEGINKYSKLLANSKIDSKKQYSINKGYVMINELKNTVYIKEDSVFLIKYKNLLEELDNM